MFSRDCRASDIVCYVHIYIGPVNIGPSYTSHFFYPLMTHVINKVSCHVILGEHKLLPLRTPSSTVNSSGVHQK